MKNLILICLTLMVVSSCSTIEDNLTIKGYNIVLEGLTACNDVTDVMTEESSEDWENRVVHYLESDLNIEVIASKTKFKQVEGCFFCGNCAPTGHELYLKVDKEDEDKLVNQWPFRKAE